MHYMRVIKKMSLNTVLKMMKEV